MRKRGGQLNRRGLAVHVRVRTPQTSSSSIEEHIERTGLESCPGGFAYQRADQCLTQHGDTRESHRFRLRPPYGGETLILRRFGSFSTCVDATRRKQLTLLPAGEGSVQEAGSLTLLMYEIWTDTDG